MKSDGTSSCWCRLLCVKVTYISANTLLWESVGLFGGLYCGPDV